MEWFPAHYIELIGVISGLVFIVLEIMESEWLWPVGIISAIFYIIVFYTSKIYADMSLQVYYLVVSVYGWTYWKKKKSKDKEGLVEIKRINIYLGLLLGFITGIIFVLISLLLVKFTDSPVPYLDALTTSLSITATWMLAKKYLEQWLVWILVNIISTGLYIYRGLQPTALLYSVFGILAIIGYIKWYKSYKSSGKEINRKYATQCKK